MSKRENLGTYALFRWNHGTLFFPIVVESRVVSNETENGKWKTENGKWKRKILTKTENGNFPENFFGKWRKVLENDLATCKFR